MSYEQAEREAVRRAKSDASRPGRTPVDREARTKLKLVGLTAVQATTWVRVMPDASLIDTHCHLDRFLANGELEAVLERAAEAGVAQLITVGTDPGDWHVYQKVASDHPRRVFRTLGLHPCHVEPDWEAAVGELSASWELHPQPVALGEIGLDYFHLPEVGAERDTIVARQHEAFRAQLTMARERDAAVIIHSRNAVEACIAEIDAAGVDWRRVVFHCWADGPELLEPILERGGRASFTGILTFRSAQNVREAALLQGVDRLMVETDAPYLAPEPHRGKPCEPGFVRYTAERAAKLFETKPEALAVQTTANARAFFKLPE
ncbi:MAG: TatD family hydrolase [Opitutales bacterium]